MSLLNIMFVNMKYDGPGRGKQPRMNSLTLLVIACVPCLRLYQPDD